MALAHSPSIITNGLVLCLDAANPKGYDNLENRMAYSEDFSQWGPNNVVRTDNTQVAPDGNQTADELYATSTTVNTGFTSKPPNGSTFTQNIWHTFSVFWKPGTSSGLVIQIPWNDGGNAGVVASFRLINGIVSPPGLGGYGNYEAASTPTTVTQYPNGWWRFSITFRPTTAPVSTASVWLYPSVNSNGSRDLNLTSYLWGAQFESGPTMTDYYPTGASIKTRGTTWFDKSGNGNNGTLVNGVGYSGDNLGSLSFDGVDDYVNCGNSSTVNLSSSFTSSCWFRVSNSAPNTTDGKGLVAKYTGGTANRSQMLYFVGNNNSVSFIVSSDGTNTASTIKSISYSSISRETWYYLTGVFTASQKMELFLNGSLVTSDTTTLSQVFSSSTQPLAIGAQAIEVSGFAFNGNISQVSIYNRALTAQEVQQNYNATKSRYTT